MSVSPQNNPSAFLEAITACHQASFTHPWHRSDFQALLELPTTRLWVANEGFLLCAEAADEMEILTLCVMPDARRRGIATALLNQMKAYAAAQGITRVFLEVSARNPAAQRLYERQGFVPNGVRPRYYHEGEMLVDALCYVLFLPKSEKRV